jgi:hypothetical protein
MKKVLIGLTLLASMSAFASINDGKYTLSDIDCKNGSIATKKKELIVRRMELATTVMNIKGNSVTLSSLDDCGASRSTYSINDKDTSSRMNFENETIANFPNTCANTQRMEDDSDLLIEKASKSRIELTVDGLGRNEICDGAIVFVYSK